jgi:hypothetical protein
MGLLGKIFGSEKVIDTGINMLDNSFYTDQEKAKHHKEFLKLYEPFKLAQRFISLSIVIPFALLGSYGIIFDKDVVDSTIGLFGTPVAIIIGFYFAGGVIGKGR